MNFLDLNYVPAEQLSLGQLLGGVFPDENCLGWECFKWDLCFLSIGDVIGIVWVGIDRAGVLCR